ncbi:MAG TPA: Ig-like domain-containing protein [Acidobacteriaceae bacterium]|jgi:hypothetical protein
MCLVLLALPGLPALAQVTITSPAAGSTSISAVTISASASEGSSFSHMEVWDNGDKLGDVFATSVNAVYVLPNGPHTMTVFAVTSGGTVLGQTNVSFTVAENCTTSTSVQCNMDQQGIDNQQNNCAPPQEILWVANPCGSGIQGSGGTDPASTNITAATESGTIADQEETTLNGKSLHLSEVQGSGGYSNVIFKVDTPQKTPTSPVQPNWTLDEYAYLPNPLAHQAFEIDAQYVISGIWTKFYTQCAFNITNGTGYWSVFDTHTGGWLYLEGQTLSDGTKVPSVPCNRSQWSQPWAYSGSGHSTNPTFSGWHHIVWKFQRNSDGSVTYVSLTLDSTTYPLNFNPPSGTGGSASNNGDFSPAVQLDGAKNTSGDYDTVDAYVNELNITHTQ